MILLCCKEINVNKPKNKMSTRSLVTKDGKPKLQLKGRIFMQNVTETISLQKPGRTVQPSPCRFFMFVFFFFFFLLTKFKRFLYMPDFLERRSRNRKLHHPLQFGGDNEEVGHSSRHTTARLEGPGALQCQHYGLEAIRHAIRLYARQGPGESISGGGGGGRGWRRRS